MEIFQNVLMMFLAVDKIHLYVLYKKKQFLVLKG
jgi:hypothetical protein